MRTFSDVVTAELQADGCRFPTFIKLEVGTDTL